MADGVTRVLELARGLLNPVAKLHSATFGHPALWRVIDMLRSEMQLGYFRQHGSHCALGRGSQVVNGKYVSLGSGVRIGRYSRIETVPQYRGQSYAPNLVIEDGVNVGWFAHIACASEMRIGKDTLIASSVYISDHNHGFSDQDTFQVRPADTPLELAPVIIGQRCWIGEKVCILPGVTIGDDCLVGAGSIVTRPVPPGTLVVGVPARPVKRRVESGEWVRV